MENYQTVEIFKALADPARLDIVKRLANEPEFVPSHDLVKSCSSLAKLSQPAMSHHLNKLVDAGILQENKVGTCKRYELNIELLAQAGIDATKL